MRLSAGIRSLLYASNLSSPLTSPSTMEFLDDERPRFLFQTRSINPATAPEPHSLHNLSKPFLFITTTISILLITVSVLYVQIEPFQSLLLWAALSLFVGPLAPSYLTAGDIRVGRGPIVQFPDPEPDSEPEGKKKTFQRRSRAAASDAYVLNPEISNGSVRSEEKIAAQTNSIARNGGKEEEKDWNEEDFETLRKQLTKHPVGKPRRWEIITEAFNGAHKVETVIKKSKELGNRKVTDKDSYAQFLKNRKPLDKPLDSGSNEEDDWSSGEDIALLNALKAFPKEAPMRWEKIAAAVPGKTKASCMKRVTDLKKGFRSAKASKE